MDLARQYDRTASTVCIILKQKELIKAIKPANGIKIISKLLTSAHEEMEKLLLVWLNEKQLTGDTMTESIPCEKAKDIYMDLVQKMHGEAAASSDVKAAEEFVKSFAELVEADGYVAQQVFNCDETGLFWKNMPRRTYIMTEEKSLPGYVESKLKGVGHQEKFVLYVNTVVGPTIKNYLTTNNLALKALLVLDNPPVHSPTLTDDIYKKFKFIWVLFFPLNTTPILQPMDQQVISNFKKLFTKHLFKHCSEVMEATNLTLQEF
ncbi:tigger transposable element-derived protein 1-like [Macrobrachium rosenbergii]|uniref:tigger transposable element-derived protein 1-like n=1 Tax=Macrobrachium rosenbergii TaxID=79674 RepID=UPI0034D47052